MRIGCIHTHKTGSKKANCLQDVCIYVCVSMYDSMWCIYVWLYGCMYALRTAHACPYILHKQTYITYIHTIAWIWDIHYLHTYRNKYMTCPYMSHKQTYITYIHTETNTRPMIGPKRAYPGSMYVCMYVSARVYKSWESRTWYDTHTYIHTSTA